MSEFYGYLQGNRGETTRCGSKSSGIWTRLQSWGNRADCSLRLVDMGKDDFVDLLNINLQSGWGYNYSPRKFILNITGLILSLEDLKTLSQNVNEFKEFLDNIKIINEL